MKKIVLFIVIFITSINLAAQTNSSEYDKGYEYYQKGDYKNALTYFLIAANHGDMNAEYNVGYIYLYGKGIEVDNKKAFDWFQKAADKGHVLAQVQLGEIYIKNENYQSAFYWNMKAADHGNYVAQTQLGWMYETGKGVAQDYQKAIEWYKRAADQGSEYAQTSLGDMYGFGKGVKQDFSKALEWYSKAAEKGYAEAQCKLGELYDGGYGVKQNYNKAFEWHLKASENGNMYSTGKIGYYYLYGEGVNRDYDKAYKYMTKAAESNDLESMKNLGFMYYYGYGVKKDYNESLIWYTKAAEMGDIASQKQVGAFYYKDKDFDKALKWYTKAADQGDANAMNTLGWYFYIGDGFSKDYQIAEKWFKKAIEINTDSPYAYSNLALLYAQRDKNYAEALRYSDLALERIVNERPETQAGFYGERGQVYVWKGDMDNAEKMLQKCLELNPKYLEGDDEFSKMMARIHSIDVDNNIVNNPVMNRNTFAIIIGNEAYKNEVGVPFAANDAKIFKEYVEKTLGVPHDQIRYVENAGYNDLRIAINWLVQAMKVCRGNGKAIVYYAGHGIPNESDLSAYLLPVDGIGNDPGSAYSLKELYDKLGSVEAQSITIFLDACFSGSKREDGMLASARGVALKAKPSAPKGNMIVFTAAQGDETAYPYKDKQHGMFTYFLLKKLQDSKGEVTLGELSDYLSDEVGRESFVKNGKMQTPSANVSASLQNSWRNLKLK